jgi:hypothetical protein
MHGQDFHLNVYYPMYSSSVKFLKLPYTILIYSHINYYSIFKKSIILPNMCLQMTVLPD